MELTIPLALGVPTVLANATAVISAGTDASVNVTSIIGTAVTPAIVIILLLLGKLRTEPEVNRLQESNAQMRQTIVDKDAQMAALQEGLVEKAIPALTRATLVLETLSPMLQTEVHLRRPAGGG